MKSRVSAAPPPAVRKGLAFPHKSPPEIIKVNSPARGKPEAFRTAGRQSRSHLLSFHTNSLGEEGGLPQSGTGPGEGVAFDTTEVPPLRTPNWVFQRPGKAQGGAIQCALAVLCSRKSGRHEQALFRRQPQNPPRLCRRRERGPDPAGRDPPFNSSATYSVLFKEKSGEESAAIGPRRAQGGSRSPALAPT